MTKEILCVNTEDASAIGLRWKGIFYGGKEKGYGASSRGVPWFGLLGEDRQAVSWCRKEGLA
ncbi:MAG TPA: hypothetical protein DCK78_17220 [Paenibacillus lactis]|nr:hypothetical protein [Paenibacillus lactis]